MPTKKTSNRPIVSIASAIESGDKKNIAARFKSFAAFQDAGATADSLAANGDHFADFKEGILLGWQGAAFAAKFLKTVEGKAILSGRVMDRFGGYEVVSKTKNDWARDLSGKIGKLRKGYTDWTAEGVAADPAVTDPAAPAAVTDPAAPAAVTDPAAPAAAPAEKRKSGAKKSLSDRILDDVAAMSTAVQRDLDAGDKAQLHAEMARDLLTAFVKVSALAKDGKIKA